MGKLKSRHEFLLIACAASAFVASCAPTSVPAPVGIGNPEPVGGFKGEAPNFHILTLPGYTVAPDPSAPHTEFQVDHPKVKERDKHHKPPKRYKRSAPPPGQGDYGAWVWTTAMNGDNGIYSGCNFQSSMTLAAPDSNGQKWMYSPTIYPSNGSPLEVQSVYTRTSSGSDRWIGIWNHARTDLGQNGYWVYFLRPTDAAWSTYVDTSSGNYWVEIKYIQSANQWRAYLWNYNWQRWDWIETAAHGGRYADTSGWTMFETWFWGPTNGASTCPSTTGYYPESRSWAVQQLSPSGGWQYLTNSVNSSVKAGTLPCSRFQFTWNTPNRDWKVNYN